MRILFIGQSGGNFSILPLRAAARNHRIVGIVESFPRDYRPPNALRRWYYGRDERWSLQREAERRSVPYYELRWSDSQDDLADFVKKLEPHVICIASMSQLLKEKVFSIPPKGTINFHPALLPRYRGPKPLLWQYYFMEPETGVTIHFIDDGEDTGDIIRQKVIPVPLGVRNGPLVQAIVEAGAELMAEALDDISAGKVDAVPQRHLPCPFRARRLKEGERLLDWEWPIERVWHFLRGTGTFNRELCSLLPGVHWTAEEHEKGAVTAAPGSFRWSVRGCWLVHGEGKIYVSPRWQATNFLPDLYRLLLKPLRRNRPVGAG